MCLAHRRQWLRGEEPRPLAQRLRRGPVCTFPGCGRPHYSGGLCKPHGSQRRRGRELYPVGDVETNRRLRREGWANLDPETHARRVARLVSVRPAVRTDEHARRLSASHRARWASDSPPLPGTAKTCPYCGDKFMPNSGRQVFCTPQCKKDHRLATKYHITIAELRKIRAGQGNVCGICRCSDRPLHVDHDHSTGAIRGLLCSTCNTGLGKLGDSVEGLRAALAYLEGDHP